MHYPRKTSATTNPFATRFTAPGELPWIEREIRSADCIDRLLELQCRAAIVGPHGSGKTSLLACLIPQLHARGLTTELHTLRRFEFSAVRFVAKLWQSKSSIVVIDGFEQLNYFFRRIASAIARSKNMGLLVTLHRHCFLPTLVETQVSAETAWCVIQEAYASAGLEGEPPVDISELEHMLSSQQGNLREVFMNLYDRFRDISYQQDSRI